MTNLDTGARRIRDAFEHELAGYQAPADLAQRARLGGLQRAKRRRLRRGLSAAGAACAALGLAVALALPSGSQARPVHVHLTAWSVDTNGNGTVTITVHQLTHAVQLQQTLAKAGVTAVVTPGEDCLTPENQKALDKTGAFKATGPDGAIIHSSAIPSGTKLLFSFLRAVPPLHGMAGWGAFGWGLVNAREPLHCMKGEISLVSPTVRR